MAKASWLVVEELLERGDPAFVDELRRIDDADRLGGFAARWYADRRPAARRFLLDYLGRPLNAYRHEALVKRLFKLAEKAGDDEVMAHFLVTFDRSLRRVRRKRAHTESAQFDNRDAATAQVTRWESEGAEHVHLSEWNDRFFIWARWADERIGLPHNTVMPRDRRDGRPDLSGVQWKVRFPGRVPKSIDDLPQAYRDRLQKFTLFSSHTRHYLRRRCWRYFRQLARLHPDRYVPAVTRALRLYQDADVADGLALLDNWGLVHLLFHNSPGIVAKTNGWNVVPGHTLAELTPAPYAESLWSAAPRELLGLVKDVPSRTVRQWALRRLGSGGGDLLRSLPLDELLGLLGHPDAEVVTLAAEALRTAEGLETVPLERWLALLDDPKVAALDVVCDLMGQRVGPERASLEQAVRLAAARPVPVARLGLHWLRIKTPATGADCRLLLNLADAQAVLVRPEIVRWVRATLSASALFQPEWVLEFLDSRHADVRGEGLAWLQADERVRNNIELWRKLLESPYDDVRLELVADLEKRVAAGEHWHEGAALDPALLQLLWASVLLNVQRGNRAKPLAVRQVTQRLTRRPSEATQLLPLLAVALRSVRGPEWRAGLAAVVQLVERQPELAPAVRQSFPELVV